MRHTVISPNSNGKMFGFTRPNGAFQGPHSSPSSGNHPLARLWYEMKPEVALQGSREGEIPRHRQKTGNKGRGCPVGCSQMIHVKEGRKGLLSMEEVYLSCVCEMEVLNFRFFELHHGECQDVLADGGLRNVVPLPLPYLLHNVPQHLMVASRQCSSERGSWPSSSNSPAWDTAPLSAFPQ